MKVPGVCAYKTTASLGLKHLHSSLQWPVTANFVKLLSSCQSTLHKGRERIQSRSGSGGTAKPSSVTTPGLRTQSYLKFLKFNLTSHPIVLYIETTECFNLASTTFLPSPAGHRAKKPIGSIMASGFSQIWWVLQGQLGLGEKIWQEGLWRLQDQAHHTGWLWHRPHWAVAPAAQCPLKGTA